MRACARWQILCVRKSKAGVVVLGAVNGESVQLVAAVTKIWRVKRSMPALSCARRLSFAAAPAADAPIWRRPAVKTASKLAEALANVKNILAAIEK